MASIELLDRRVINDRAVTASPRTDALMDGFIAKMPSVLARPCAAYPGSLVASKIKGGASFQEACRQARGQIARFYDIRSGSGAYIGASALSTLPIALADPLKKLLESQNIEPRTAENIAVGSSSLVAGSIANCRNLAFKTGIHGIDTKKIFKPMPLAACFVRDTATAAIYARSMQSKPEISRREKTRDGVLRGFVAGVLTSPLDTFAYLAAKEKVSVPVWMFRTMRVMPLRGLNVAFGSAVVASLAK